MTDAGQDLTTCRFTVLRVRRSRDPATSRWNTGHLVARPAPHSKTASCHSSGRGSRTNSQITATLTMEGAPLRRPARSVRSPGTEPAPDDRTLDGGPCTWDGTLSPETVPNVFLGDGFKMKTRGLAEIARKIVLRPEDRSGERPYDLLRPR